MIDWNFCQSVLTNNNSKKISSYDLVYVSSEKGKAKINKLNDIEYACVFTDKEHAQTHECSLMMLGSLMEYLSTRSGATPVFINPKGEESDFKAEEVIFAPMFDKFTKKYLMTRPEGAKALLALSKEDEKRFGVEFTFFVLGSNDLSADSDKKLEELRKMINSLAFLVPRTHVRKGSGSFITVILNFGNELDELAFIRSYNVLDTYSDVIFVTSSLKLLRGDLNEIHYSGESVDTILYPLINWQQTK